MAANSIAIFKSLPAALLIFAISIGSAAEQWMPPQDPNPEEIRRGADNDAREGRYELASQKYVWYHENALKYQPSLAGVRLSFALAGWRRLANQYPPALREIKGARDRAEEWVRNSKDGSSVLQTIAAIKGTATFQDAAALNRILKEDSRTIDLFKWLDEHDPDFAHQTYIIAQDALVEAGEFALCETYLTGRNTFDEIMKGHNRQIGWMERHYGGADNAPHIDSHYLIFARQVAYIVAILVNRDRLSDAKTIAEQAMQELEDEELRNQIAAALQGIPPERLM